MTVFLFCSLLLSIPSANADALNATAWNNVGQQLFALERYSDALLAYNHALLIRPEYSLVLANRCGVLSQMGEYSQALASCDLALKVNHHWGVNGSALGWDNRGNVLFNLEQYQEALDSFEKALIYNPGYENARRNRQIVLTQLDQATDR
ncbi:MAG: tetratricopeptide repeat protein [Cyanobacteria bacterium P01_D01_bin.56]